MRTKTQIWVPLLLFGLMLFDGSLSTIFTSHFYSYPNVMISRLVLLGLVLVSFFLPDMKHLLLWAFIIGLFYDSFYTGILGVYTFLFPLIVYLTRQIRVYFTPTAIAIGAIYLIELTILESFVYGMNRFMGLTTATLANFIPDVLGPTLLLNLVYFVILYFPLRQLLLKLGGTTV
ncbi:rod shape-determining protein MreD [Loigolactobacillus backii]|uniref:rod shape-determining protein MreD n=1 Tax=Loigolactobacillus backii TaxID=375175 RepID=UPI000C1C9780|nr:rod shape-determining protein MreD [Loigolactobacillus backii]PIO83691.1 rod shape-determining protein MreD [Loigolactobacillus backii]